ncbi:MAG TPA: 2'-5' RNA ligase family protein [Terriglobales bacterium]|nr:2'-5' RNA ligase family protein [Terriglobales bacterium]
MAEQRQYALVAYIRNAVGQFVESLRSELHPAHAHLPAHITILPPRCMSGTEEDAISLVESICRSSQPFQVTLGDVENFMPITPTVFIRVAFGAYRVRELHDTLNAGPLFYAEQWPYMPHLTIVKVDSMEVATHSLDIARDRWARFDRPRRVMIEELTFVRSEKDLTQWTDLASVPLGKQLVHLP